MYSAILVIHVKTNISNLHSSEFFQLSYMNLGRVFFFLFCVLIFYITRLGWTYELLNKWNAAPTCLSALLKTCKQISFRLNNWYHRLLWLHNKYKFPRRGGSLTKLSSKHKADIISCKYIDCIYLKALDILWAISWDMRACFTRSTSSHAEPALINQMRNTCSHEPLCLGVFSDGLIHRATQVWLYNSKCDR